jgi:PAS domain-containing protein
MRSGETPDEDAVPLADVIDSLSAGVFLIGGDGVIVHANAQARAILASTCCASCVDGSWPPIPRPTAHCATRSMPPFSAMLSAAQHCR